MIKEDYVKKPSLRLKQDYDRYTMTSDTLHLGAFIKLRKHDKVLDVGTNNGVLALMAASQTQERVLGIDVDADAIALAKENAEINRLNCSFMLCAVQNFVSETALDVIICNPPYFVSQSKQQNIARFDHNLSLEELAMASQRLLKDKGRLYIILKINRMIEAIGLFENFGLVTKRIQMIHHSQSHRASSVCLELSKNGKSHLIVEAPILNLKEK